LLAHSGKPPVNPDDPAYLLFACCPAEVYILVSGQCVTCPDRGLWQISSLSDFVAQPALRRGRFNGAEMLGSPFSICALLSKVRCAVEVVRRHHLSPIVAPYRECEAIGNAGPSHNSSPVFMLPASPFSCRWPQTGKIKIIAITNSRGPLPARRSDARSNQVSPELEY